MSDISPFIRYRDARAAIDFLERAFGFELLSCHDGPDGSVAHAELRAGDGVIQVSTLEESDGGSTVAGPNGVPTIGIYMVVPDPDAHHERAKSGGAQILMPPTDEDYGGRDYTCRDPEGYLWSFGTYVPGEPHQ